MFEFRNVSFSYEDPEGQEPEYDKRSKKIKIDETLIPKKVFAVEDLNFTIADGEFVSIIGRNGSGKSTCAKLMNGLLLPENGTILVQQINTAETEMVWEIRRNVGMVFQNPDNQIIGTTVEEDVAFGPENLGVPHEEMVERVYRSIERVGLKGFEKKEPHLLSGGQKQRVAIAGILAMNPKCIVLDEATAMLDPVGRREVMGVITELNRDYHITIVLITHHMDEVALTKRAILIDKGRLIADGTPKQIFSHRDEIYEAGLELPQVTQLFYRIKNELSCDIPADIIDINEGTVLLETLLKGKSCKAEYCVETVSCGHFQKDLSLKVDNVSYTYQKNTPFESEALHDVSVEIVKGSFTGIIGHTGCGKSTLVQHLNGLLRPEQGDIYVDGERMTDENLNQLRKKVGLVFQYPEYQLFEETVYKDVAYGLRREKLSEAEKRDKILSALEIVGMDETLASRSIYDLSGGQKRRVALAGVIVMSPDYLVLDEPAAGLDPAGRDEILGYLKRLQQERGTTIVLVSHSMEDIARLADYIYVMNDAQVVLSGTVPEVFRGEKKLSEIGLAVPQITTLWNQLRKKLPELPGDIYTVDDAFKAVAAHMGGQVK